MEHPHLIMIVADQLRCDVLGKGFTPHIDALAREGVNFANTYCASPLCVPARGALFTGLCPATNGSRINPWLAQDAAAGQVHEGTPNLYALMERGGWDCLHSGKQHFFTEGGKLEDDPATKTKWLSTDQSYAAFLAANGKRTPGGPRFRTPVPELAGGAHTRLCNYSNAETGLYEEGPDYYFDGYFTDCALRGLRERDMAKPLFLSAMFLAPHPPFDIPDPWYSRYAAKDVHLPENVGHWYPYQSPLQMYNLTGVVGSRYTLPQWREAWRVYMGLVSLLDDCVGRLLEELKRQEIYEDSLIVFTADHGEMLGSHRLFQKMCMYEESARVPLYMRFPHGAHDGTHVQRAVSHMDVLPTLCRSLAIPAPVCEGISLHPLWEGTDALPPRDIFIQFDGNGALSNFQRCIVRENYKLIADIFKDEVYFELYDTKLDPQEKVNLLFGPSVPSVAYSMLQSLLEHIRSTHDSVLLPQTDLKAFVNAYRPLAAAQGAIV